MKKIVSIVLFILIICTMLNVNASAPASDVGVYANVKEQSSNKMVIEYGLLNFVEVEEGQAMVITMTLDYDTSVISSVQAQGIGNWSASFEEGTKRLVLETNSGKANTGVVQLTFNINQSATINSSNNKITLKDINISEGENLDKYDENHTFEISLNNDEENGGNTAKPGNNTNTANNNGSQNGSTNSRTNSISGNVDKTVAKNQLPKAGFKNIAVIAIVVIAVAVVIFKIKSRKIKY